ncbi:MAG: hypothetical protein J6J30_00630 [Clostridia bacterium]|nr:hypothetical protein [Oscillospiraceae bacterium]MBP3599566.1 hypothetical protein [Clostridia bacterium]
MSDNLHKEHRKRLRNEFLSQGFNDSTPKHKLLELLMFYSIPRKDTNDIAHLLIEHFGSFARVIDAPIEELQKVNGVGENTALLISLMKPIIRAYVDEKQSGKKSFENMDEIGKYLSHKYIGFTKEVFSILSLDNKGGLIGFDIIAEGDVGTVNVSTRAVVEAIVKRNSRCIVLAHNHPGGNAIPSKEDIETTATLCEALRNINVAVLDHVIICDDDYVSLSVSQNYRHMFRNGF